MNTRFSEATDGRRLLHVETELQSPDADAPVVIVTYEMFTPEGFKVKANTVGLVLLSSVRKDTFESITLDRDQMIQILNAAVAASSNFDPDW